MRTSREYFDASGTPEDSDVSAKLDEAGREIVRNVKEGDYMDEVNELWEKTPIRFDVLKKVFEDIAKKSGIDDINFLGRESIKPNTEGLIGSMGEYFPKENIIGLSIAGLQRKAREAGVSPELRILHALCHEEVHATSKQKHFGLVVGRYSRSRDGIKWPIADFKKQSVGFLRVVKGEDPNGGKLILHNFLNEGVAEKLAQEVLSEYLSHDQDFPSNIDMNSSEKKGKKGAGGFYDVPIKMVDVMIKSISMATGFSEEMVWRGFVRGIYEGEDIGGDDFRELSREIFPEGFLDDIAELNPVDDFQVGQAQKLVEKLEKYIETTEMRRSIKGRIILQLRKIKWLQLPWGKKEEQ